MSKRIVVTDHEFEQLTEEARIASEVGARFEVYQATDRDAALAATRGADVVLTNYAPMDREVLAGLAERAVVIRYGIGFDNVDIEAARELGVRVCNVPDYGASTVADHTVMLVLATLRRCLDLHSRIVGEPDGWGQASDLGPVLDLADAVHGLVGAGQIARHVAHRMQAFGTTVIASDPYADAAALAEQGIELVPLEELLRRADIVSLHAPLTPETHHIIGAEQLDAMKPGAIVVNTARGPLLDTVAAARALQGGRLGGLGLDVFETEPLEPGHPLRSAPRALLTPHAAFYSQRALHNLQLFAAEEAGRACRGEALRCEVTR